MCFCVSSAIDLSTEFEDKSATFSADALYDVLTHLYYCTRSADVLMLVELPGAAVQSSPENVKMLRTCKDVQAIPPSLAFAKFLHV